MSGPVHVDEVERHTWYAGTEREIHDRALSDVGGAAKVGVGLMELPPGCDTRPAHWHSHEEEHLYVIAGTGMLHLGDARHPLAPGCYVRFAAGEATPHHIENDGSVPLVYLIVGERIADDRVTHVDG